VIVEKSEGAFFTSSCPPETLKSIDPDIPAANPKTNKKYLNIVISLLSCHFVALH